MSIPLVDLQWQHRVIADEVTAGFDRVMRAGSFVLGDEVEAFEREFAAYCDVDHCVGVGNGTDAIELALRALGIGAGDEVILPANTFIATAEAVVRAGAMPVVVDCTADTQLIDPAAVSAAVTERTRAVVPVHLFGQAAAVDAVRAAAGSDVAIVEDAAQSQGARAGGRRAGSLGAVAATSFYPGKNLGAYGDGGAVLTGDAAVAQRLRSIRNHGSEVRYRHDELGVNSRLDSLQAVVLRAKLRRLDEWNALRREAARRYDDALRNVERVHVPVTAEENEHVWHLYVVRVPERDRVLKTLQANGIGAGVHYPIPVHRQRAFEHLGLAAGSFPVAEQLAAEILSLPLYPGITESQQEQVVGALAEALR